MGFISTSHTGAGLTRQLVPDLIHAFMKSPVVLLGEVLTSQDNDVECTKVRAMPEGFPDHTLDPISLYRTLEVTFGENQSKPGSPKGVG